MIGLIMKYFVLNPSKNDAYGYASRQAMRTYANIIRAENQELSDDLIKWIDRERKDGIDENPPKNNG